MIRAFIVFAVVFGAIFALIWLASFTGYFDKARVKRIVRIALVSSITVLLAITVVTFLFALEHSIF